MKPQLLGPWHLGEEGATAFEYGLLAALVAVVKITGLTGLGRGLTSKFSSVASDVQSAAPESEDDSSDEATATSPAGLIETPTAAATNTIVAPIPSSTPAPKAGRESLCWLGPGNDKDVVSVLEIGAEVEVKGAGMRPTWIVIDNPHCPGVLCWVREEALEIPDGFTSPDTLFAVPTIPVPTPIQPSDSGDKSACFVAGECKSPCPDPEFYNPCSP